jgi:hypothetical protein
MTTKSKYTVSWEEEYVMDDVEASSPEEAIEIAKQRIVSRKDEGDARDVKNFHAVQVKP